MLIKVAIINDTRTADGHYGCSTVMSNLEVILKKSAVEILWTWPVGKDWREHKDYLLSLGKVDALIVNGEGTIHNSSEKRKMPESLSQLAAFAKKEMGIPAYLINSTIYMNKEKLYRELLNYNKIYVRDTMSQQECLSHGVEVNYAPDLSMLFPVCENEELKRSGIGVTDSFFKEKTIQLKKVADRNDWDFVPMVRRREARYEGLISKFGKILNRKDKESEGLSFLSNTEFIKWLRSKNLVVTGRYHTVTLCILTRTPFIAVESNTPKITALLKDVFGDSSRILYDISLVNPESEVLNRFSMFSEKEIVKIDEYFKKIEELNLNMIKAIIEDIKASSFE